MVSNFSLVNTRLSENRANQGLYSGADDLPGPAARFEPPAGLPMAAVPLFIQRGRGLTMSHGRKSHPGRKHSVSDGLSSRTHSLVSKVTTNRLPLFNEAATTLDYRSNRYAQRRRAASRTSLGGALTGANLSRHSQGLVASISALELV